MIDEMESTECGSCCSSSILVDRAAPRSCAFKPADCNDFSKVSKSELTCPILRRCYLTALAVLLSYLAVLLISPWARASCKNESN